jgi:hypothetical protein
MADFFETQLCILALFCGVAVLFERYGLKAEGENNSVSKGADEDEVHLGGLSRAASRLGLKYLGVYAIVMGPYTFYYDFRCSLLTCNL